MLNVYFYYGLPFQNCTLPLQLVLLCSIKIKLHWSITLNGYSAATSWGNPLTGAGGKVLPGKDPPVRVLLLCFHQDFNPARLCAAPAGLASCWHRREGRSLLLQASSFSWPSSLSQAHPSASTGRGVGWLLWVTVLIYSTEQYSSLLWQFNISLKHPVLATMSGECCAGWVLLTWYRSHCYNGSIKTAAISRMCPDCT